MASVGIWRGAERATGNIARTSMGLLNYQAQRADAAARQAEAGLRTGLMQRRVDMAEQQAELQNRATQMQIADFQKGKKLRSVYGMLDKIGIKRPAEREAVLRYLGPIVENVNGLPMVENRYLRKIWKDFKGDKQAQVSLATIRGREIAKELKVLESGESKLKGDDLANKIAQLNAESEGAANVIKMHIKPTKPVAPKITKVDLGDRVDIYTNGVKTGSVKKGAAPTSGGLKVGGQLEKIIHKIRTTGELSHNDKKALEIIRKTSPTKKEAVFRLIAQDRFFMESTPKEQAEKMKRAAEVVDIIFGEKETLVGKPPGVYLVDGQEVEWDGQQILEPDLQNMELPRTGKR